MKIVIVLLAVLLAGGGGFGAGWYLFGRHPEPAAANAGTPPPPPPPPEPTGPPQFVTVGPITVPVLTSDRVDQFVTLGVALELGDASTAEKVKQQAPRLTDAFLTALYGTLTPGVGTRTGMVDIPAVKAKLIVAAAKILGNGIVRNVLVQVISQRPM